MILSQINQSQIDCSTNFDEFDIIKQTQEDYKAKFLRYKLGSKKQQIKIKEQQQEIQQANQKLQIYEQNLQIQEQKINQYQKEIANLEEKLKENRLQMDQMIKSLSDGNSQNDINGNDLLNNSWETQQLQNYQVKEKQIVIDQQLQHLNKWGRNQLNRDNLLIKRESIVQNKYEDINKKIEDVYKNQIDGLNEQMKELKEKCQKYRLKYKENKKENQMIKVEIYNLKNQIGNQQYYNKKIEEIQKEYQNINKKFEPGVFTDYINQLNQKYQDLQQMYEQKNNGLDQLHLESKKYFNKDLSLQLFEEIKKDCDQRILDSFQNYQNLQCQHDQQVQTLNTLNSECQQKLNIKLEPQIFKQINDQLEQRQQLYIYYQQIYQQLQYECEKEFQNHLDMNVFKNIKQAHKEEISKIQKLHQKQVNDLNIQMEQLKDDLNVKQKQIDILTKQRIELENKIKELKLEIETQKETQNQDQNPNNEFLVSSLQKKVDMKDKELQQQIMIQQNFKIEYEKQINNLSQNIQNMKLELKQKKQTIKDLNQQFQKQIDELKQSNNQQIQQRDKQIDQLKSDSQEYKKKISQLEILILNNQQNKEDQKNQSLLQFKDQRIEQENENQQKQNQIEMQKKEIMLLKQQKQQELESKNQQIKILKISKNQIEEQQKQVKELIDFKIDEFNANDNHQQQQILLLNSIIDFLVQKFISKQSLKIIKTKPLFQLMFEYIYDYQQNIVVDPFSNNQIMVQDGKYNILQLSVNNNKLKEIALLGHPPNFEQVINFSQQNITQVWKKSIHTNKESNYFEGYFIKCDENQLIKSNQLNFSFVRKQIQNYKYYPNNNDLQELQYQLGNQLLLEFFMNQFNQILKDNNLDYPQLQLPQIIIAQNIGDSKYLYIEGMISNQLNNTQTYKLYINSLKYYSYYCSKGNYMITEMYIFGNYIYDSIVSSKYSILSYYDQGKEEIIKQSLELNPKNYSYEKYQQIMHKLVI